MTALTLQNPAPLPSGKRFPALDELKGFALLLVISYHASAVLLWPNYVHGEVGVDMFLIVSGLTLSLSANVSAREFWIRRFLRIFPAYWAAFAFYYILNYTLRSVEIPSLSIWLHLLGLHAFGPQEAFFDVNDSFWFIALIVPLYIIFFFLRRHVDRPSWIVAAGSFVTIVACLAYQHAGHLAGFIHIGLRVPSFFFGLVLGGLLGRREWKLTFDLPFGLAVLGMTYLTFLANVPFFCTIAGASLTIFFLSVRDVLGRWGASRWLFRGLGVLGIYSYEIFLLHQPLIREYNVYALNHWLRIPEATRGQVVAGMGVGLIVAGILAFGLHHATRALFSRVAKGTSGRTSRA